MNPLIRLLPLIAALLILCVLPLAAQPEPSARAAIYLKDGTGISGYITSINQQTLSLETGAGTIELGIENIRQVAVLESSAGQGGLLGLVGGFYGGVLFGIVSSAEGPYLGVAKNGNLLSQIAFGELGAALGGIIGFIVDDNESHVRSLFTLDGSPAARNRLVEFLDRGPLMPKRWNFTLHASFVDGKAPAERATSLIGAGYQGRNSFDTSIAASTEQFEERISDLAWLRKAELSYAVTPELQAGLVYAILDQHEIKGSRNEVIGTGNRYQEVTESYSGTALLASGRYRIRLGPSRRWQASIGTGAGLARTGALQELYTWNTDRSTFTVERDDEIEHSGSGLGAIVMAELLVPISRSLMFGISADYLLVPALTIPADVRSAVPEGVVRLSGPSFGFVLGLRF